MHVFDYSMLKDDLLPAQLVTLAANIASLKTMTGMRRESNVQTFLEMETLAKIESVKASNAIEGLVTTDDRIRDMVERDEPPRNHTEAEIAGYRDVLNEIHGHCALHDFKESDIRAFHAQMMHLVDATASGGYKTEDNVVAERLPDGRRVVRFQPLSAVETPDAMRQLELAYAEARDDAAINKLLLVPCVILDFLCIHPFADGNGRMSRLLSLLLLYRNGYDVGKYVSFEGAVNKRKLEYYEALRASSVGWRENETRYFPFMINFLTTLYACYAELDRRFAAVNAKRISKTERITATLLNSLTPLGKRDVCAVLPDVSPTTVEWVLGTLLRAGCIRKIGAGRDTKYLRN